MTKETVVHVTTIEEWKSVLDVWFGKGYKWLTGDNDYGGELFEDGSRQYLHLDNQIYASNAACHFIEYAEFMAQQEKTMDKETYYVTQEQLDLIEELKYDMYPVYQLLHSGMRFNPITSGLDEEGEKALLRYVGGDTSIEFKVKEQLYRLWHTDDKGNTVYMSIVFGTPSFTYNDLDAFKAPLEEINNWNSSAWKIEEAN